VNQYETRTGVLMALKRGGSAGLVKRQKKCKGVSGWELTCKGERLSERVSGMQGAEVAEGSHDIRLEAGECPDRT
jgi:hypothetical protein